MAESKNEVKSGGAIVKETGDLVKLTEELLEKSRQRGEKLDDILGSIDDVNSWEHQRRQAEDARRAKDARDVAERERHRKAIEEDSTHTPEPAIQETKPKRTLADLGARSTGVKSEYTDTRTGDKYDGYQNGGRRRRDGSIFLFNESGPIELKPSGTPNVAQTAPTKK